MTHHSIYERVSAAIAEIQPVLGLHGGSIDLVDITPENVVRIRFKGACEGCLAADYTLEYGLKEVLMLQIPEIEDVEAVNTEPKTHQPPTPPPLPHHAEPTQP